jgi:hypothetical protein
MKTQITEGLDSRTGLGCLQGIINKDVKSFSDWQMTNIGVLKPYARNIPLHTEWQRVQSNGDCRNFERWIEDQLGIDMDNVDKLLDVKATIGTRIWFSGEYKPYHVRARSDRFLVCTKPFNIRHTTIYTIVDLEKLIRGTEGVAFGLGAETDKDCMQMIARLEGRSYPNDFYKEEMKTEVSHRNRVNLDIFRVKFPKKPKSK